ncbi:MAG: DUF2254 domain-containing protein [Pseudomonadota bacterium]
MIARLRKLLAALGDTFWLLPAFIVIAAGLLAVACVELDRSGRVPRALIDNAWLYNGGGTGARTLLGVVAGSAIGVASTVFSITIAALSLAAGQMGPRLLRNFVRDRGNQLVLGTLLGTFTYALMVLRSVRTMEEGEFTPHLSMSVGILLALCCVATIIFFVGHIAGRINVDTVIDLVGDDVSASLRRIRAAAQRPDARGAPVDWTSAVPVLDSRAGYLQQLDEDGLADWAEVNHAQVRLLARPGHYVFPGAPLALVKPAVPGVEEAVRAATALGAQRASNADIEFAIRQLVEVAIRALSPGINDPYTAINVLDRLGAALCELSGVHLPSGVFLRNERVVLVVPSIDYDGLVDAMFHMIRQSGNGHAAVLIRLMEILSVVQSCETDSGRRATLKRHAEILLGDAQRSIGTPADLADLRQRYEAFCAIGRDGIAAFLVSQ